MSTEKKSGSEADGGGASTDAKAIYKEGFGLFAKGEVDEAIARYRAAIEADATLAIAWNGLSMALAKRGDLDAAIEAAERLVELEPDDPLSHTNLSRILMQKGLIPEAEDARARHGSPDAPAGLVVIGLEREGDVFVLRVDDGENRFRPESLAAWHAALDEVEAAGSPAALVTTGEGKFYSNGLDLAWMMGEAKPEEREAYIPSVLALMARVLTFPTITVAAINGHAFGAGAQISLGHDFRVMRLDRGFWCMPEIDMKSPLHPGMTAIIKARVPVQVAHELIVTGTRYTAEAALARRIVDHAVPEDEVVSKAIEIAAPLAGKADPAMRLLKQGMYPKVLDALGLPMSEVPG